MLLSPPLNRAHAPLFLVPFFLTFLTLAFSLLSNFLVRRARRLESERICRMLTDVAGRERAGGDEGVARALVGMQGKGAWGRFVGFILSVLELIAGLAGVIIVTVCCNLSAYQPCLTAAPPDRPLHFCFRWHARAPVISISACRGPTIWLSLANLGSLSMHRSIQLE